MSALFFPDFAMVRFVIVPRFEAVPKRDGEAGEPGHYFRFERDVFHPTIDTSWRRCESLDGAHPLDRR